MTRILLVNSAVYPVHKWMCVCQCSGGYLQTIVYMLATLICWWIVGIHINCLIANFCAYLVDSFIGCFYCNLTRISDFLPLLLLVGKCGIWNHIACSQLCLWGCWYLTYSSFEGVSFEGVSFDHRIISAKIHLNLFRNKKLLWEPYPSHHNGLFSPLLVLRDFAARRQINIGVIRTVRDFLPFLCNSIFLV